MWAYHTRHFLLQLLAFPARLALLGLLLASDASYGQAANAQQVIKGVEEIRRLGSAAIGRKAEVVGVTTFLRDHGGFIQDNDLGIYFDTLPTIHGIAVGDAVKIVGTIAGRDKYTYLKNSRLERLGTLDLPMPLEVDLAELEFGDYECRYVRVKAHVNSASSSESRTLFDCTWNGVNFLVRTTFVYSTEEMLRLIGHDFEVDGVLATQRNDHLPPRLKSFRIDANAPLLSTDPTKISQVEAPTADEPPETEQDSFDFQGTVIGQAPDFFLLSGTTVECKIHTSPYFVPILGNTGRYRGIIYRDREGNPRHEAKTIEVQRGGRKFARRAARADLAMQPHEWEALMGQVITIEGVPDAISMDARGLATQLALRDGNNHLDAILYNPNNAIFPDKKLLEVASTLQLTGALTTGADGQPLLLVGELPNSIVVTKRKRTILQILRWVVLPFTILAVLSTIWVKSLRKQVRRQTFNLDLLNSQLVSAYESIEDGIIAVSNNSKVLAVNPSFRRLTQLDLKVGDPFHLNTSLLEFASRTDAEVQLTAFLKDLPEQSAKEFELEFNINAPEKHCVWLKIRPFVSELSNSQLGTVILLRDRTEEKQLKAELIQSNKMEAIGQLTGSVAHDFNNMLTVILATLSIAKHDGDASPRLQTLLDEAESAAHSGATIIERLLAYSGKVELELKPMDVNQLILRFHELIKHMFDARVKMRFELTDDPEAVCKVDRTAIEQVLLNLYLNARDAMPDGGTIKTVTTVDTDMNRLTIRVLDDGTGIPKPIRKRIFEPFFTTKIHGSGTGLGLSTSRRIISEHQGEIDCISSPGVGTEFRIYLPLSSDGKTTELELPSTEMLGFSAEEISATILVADDDDAVRRMTVRVLESFGFNVLSAPNGTAALAILNTERDRIAALVIDLTMPGVSGTDVVEAIERTFDDLPVVLCSGYFAGADLPFSRGSTIRLAKPYTSEQLIGAILSVLPAPVRGPN